MPKTHEENRRHCRRPGWHALTAPAAAQVEHLDTTVASASEKGFSLKSADGSFEFKLRGLLQADTRFFVGDEPPQRFNDTALLRRAEPAFELLLGKLAFFRLQPQFTGDVAAVLEAYGELRFAPAVSLRFGKFKTPLGLRGR